MLFRSIEQPRIWRRGKKEKDRKPTEPYAEVDEITSLSPTPDIDEEQKEDAPSAQIETEVKEELIWERKRRGKKEKKQPYSTKEDTPIIEAERVLEKSTEKVPPWQRKKSSIPQEQVPEEKLPWLRRGSSEAPSEKPGAIRAAQLRPKKATDKRSHYADMTQPAQKLLEMLNGASDSFTQGKLTRGSDQVNEIEAFLSKTVQVGDLVTFVQIGRAHV